MSESQSIERKNFNKLLTNEQVDSLQNYYSTVEKMPRRAAKTELSKLYGIEAVLITKWFQSRRNKDKAALKKQATTKDKNITDEQNNKEENHDTMNCKEDNEGNFLNGGDMKLTSNELTVTNVSDKRDPIKDEPVATKDDNKKNKIDVPSGSTSKKTIKVSKTSSKSSNKADVKVSDESQKQEIISQGTVLGSTNVTLSRLVLPMTTEEKTESTSKTVSEKIETVPKKIVKKPKKKESKKSVVSSVNIA
ncbi:hypothetical protein BDK51DRAFT_33400 [Blyttiomyces helicus]|uniref:Homeobox domain-containing protein n=1 Tax=Blyttiomyces helicus TaxID=388810 RepID=A0A4P9WQL2_9FUNG|nr:hypothetical protein BDK51DRAFT_33400 [Blyttiomyces helicus]|eukprot:RKO94685.1 hypothetical protein BDK51DRAFT_33400 [Blyttiomyces helicus]